MAHGSKFTFRQKVDCSDELKDKSLKEDGPRILMSGRIKVDVPKILMSESGRFQRAKVNGT